MCSRHLNPHTRRCVHLLKSEAQYSRRFNTRAEDLITVVGGFHTIHRPTRQVHQRAGAIQVTYPVTQCARIPGDETQPTFSQRFMAAHDDNLTAETVKVSRQIPTQESCASCYHNSARRYHPALSFWMDFALPRNSMLERLDTLVRSLCAQRLKSAR